MTTAPGATVRVPHPEETAARGPALPSALAAALRPEEPVQALA